MFGKIKKSFAVLFAVLLMVSGICITSCAAGSVISLSSKSVSVNQPLTVTVTINSDEAMYGVGCTVTYDPAVLQFNSGDSANGGAGAVKIASAASGKKQTFSLSFTAIAAGNSTVSVGDCQYSGIDETEKGISGAGASVSVTDAAQSSNTDLKSLSLNNGTLSPNFSPKITSYTATVTYDITDSKVYVRASDPSAKVDVSGTSKLEVGNNSRTITVTAPSGETKQYTIVVKRLTEEETEAFKNGQLNEEPQEDNTVKTTINNINYTILTDLTNVTLLNGFAADTVEFDGKTVAVAKDAKSNYVIYYLVEEGTEEPVAYIKDKDTDNFTKLNYVIFGNNSYILADIPNGYSLPDGYFISNVDILGNNIKCYASSNTKLSDFYYVYCYANGTYMMYRYDSVEQVLQRFPELSLEKVTEKTEKTDENFIARFNSLNNNEKIIVVCLLLAIIGVIALIVLLIIKLTHSKNENNDDYEDSMEYLLDDDNSTVFSVVDDNENENKKSGNKANEKKQ